MSTGGVPGRIGLSYRHPKESRPLGRGAYGAVRRGEENEAMTGVVDCYADLIVHAAVNLVGWVYTLKIESPC